jgi:hypothetical protein
MEQRYKVQNEGTYSLELGYSGKLSENLQLNVDGYYQRYEHLLGWVLFPEGMGTIMAFKNLDGANAYGAECSLTYRHKKGNLTVWYAYNGIETEQRDQITRSVLPATNKAGLAGRLFLDNNWTFNTNFAFQSRAKGKPNNTTEDCSSFNRLDLSLSRKFAKGKGELMIGVTDVLNGTTDANWDVAHFAVLETPGRMFFGRLQFTF